jgi:putative phosphoribosyl transferase
VIERAKVTIGSNGLVGALAIPDAPAALVIFAHRSGSSRFSERNRHAADIFVQRGFATLLFDLSTESEASGRRNVFDVALLGARIVQAIDWAATDPGTAGLPLGIFGVSAGAQAAVVAAACRPTVGAIVLRGGRPDLAGNALVYVGAPTLMLVGDKDRQLLARNVSAMNAMRCETSLAIVSGAGPLFEELGTLDRAQEAATAWFDARLRVGAPISGARTETNFGAASSALSSCDRERIFLAAPVMSRDGSAFRRAVDGLLSPVGPDDIRDEFDGDFDLSGQKGVIKRAAHSLPRPPVERACAPHS